MSDNIKPPTEATMSMGVLEQALVWCGHRIARDLIEQGSAVVGQGATLPRPSQAAREAGR